MGRTVKATFEMVPIFDGDQDAFDPFVDIISERVKQAMQENLASQWRGSGDCSR